MNKKKIKVLLRESLHPYSIEVLCKCIVDSCQMCKVSNLLNLTCTPVNHQTGLCRTWGATEVENKAKAVLVPSWVKHRTVEFCLILSLSQPVKGQRRRRGLLWSEPHHRCSTCSHLRGNTCSNTCVLIQQHFPIDVSTRWGYQFNSHRPFTTTPISIAIFHQELIGEDAGQVERPGALHVLCCVRRPQSHSYEVLFCEGEGAGQLNTLGTEGFDWLSSARSDLVDAVPPYLVVLHGADLYEESRVDVPGASLEVFVCGYPNLKRDRRGDVC